MTPEKTPTLAGVSLVVWRRVALAAWFLVLVSLTLVPQPRLPVDRGLARISACLICGDRGASDAILNVLLFLPLGLLLEVPGWKARHVLVAAFVLSLSIEVLQVFVPGRYSNLGDVAWNTSGGWLGAFLGVRRGS